MSGSVTYMPPRVRIVAPEDGNPHLTTIEVNGERWETILGYKIEGEVGKKDQRVTLTFFADVTLERPAVPDKVANADGMVRE